MVKVEQKAVPSVERSARSEEGRMLEAPFTRVLKSLSNKTGIVLKGIIKSQSSRNG